MAETVNNYLTKIIFYIEIKSPQIYKTKKKTGNTMEDFDFVVIS